MAYILGWSSKYQKTFEKLLDLGDVGVSKLKNYLINAKKHILKTHTKQQIKCTRDDTILKEGE